MRIRFGSFASFQSSSMIPASAIEEGSGPMTFHPPPMR